MKRIVVLLLVLFAFWGCKKTNNPLFEEGVSIELANERSQSLANIVYRLSFELSSALEEAPKGRLILGFDLLKEQQQLLLDFKGPGSVVHSMQVNGADVEVVHAREHLIVEGKALKQGRNEIVLEFTSSSMSLNRNEAFLYTLLVPDRAATLFPCFDQPDLKAIFEPELIMPAQWTALSNGPIVEEKIDAYGRRQIRFAPSHPISTYLFAFVAGEFKKVEHTSKQRSFTLLHRETDDAKVQRSLPVIFSQHEQALEWLETYTGISYPFEKLDFALIPGFQYSGMEHPGCIFYRDSRLLLDENPSEPLLLRRASLIAHETAHMWFGNLVTMKWFDDVWLKEVFAGFMADKMVAPVFPDINHKLAFLLSHSPNAMSIDRSQGAHPIKQQLPNLKEAGTVYGAIIYNKAPIVFQQLEYVMGEEAFQKAVHEYLRKFSYASADWSELVEIFDAHAAEDITQWSLQWVYGAGLPIVNARMEEAANGGRELILTYKNDKKHSFSGRQWLDVAFHYADTTYLSPIALGSEEVKMALPRNEMPLFVLPNAAGRGYARFVPDTQSRKWLLENGHQIADPLMRAAVYLNLWEDFLNENIAVADIYALFKAGIEKEEQTQILQYLLGITRTVYWSFLKEETRALESHFLEELLWKKLEASAPDARTLLLPAWAGICLSDKGIEKMYQLWVRDKVPEWLKITEDNEILMSKELILRKHPLSEQIIEEQLNRIVQPERRDDFRFILPALSDDYNVRDAFFNSLKQPENRKPEPRVSEALMYFHHPLRHSMSFNYLRPSLSMLHDVQKTGDIFFPKDWLNAVLWSYNSRAAARIVRDYVKKNRSLPAPLKLKLLQSADLLFRAAERTI